MTYHPIVRWTCSDCLGRGEVDRAPVETCDETWDKVVRQHSEVSPNCFPLNYGRNITLHPETGTLPE